jgi:hypothetical protein
MNERPAAAQVDARATGERARLRAAGEG